MLFNHIKLLLVTGLGVGSLVIAGCAQERQFDTTTETGGTTVVTAPETNTAQTPTNTTTQQEPSRAPDVPYVPTPQPVVDRMLEIANVGANDVLYDLGSGDGRIPITAAQKHGTRATGVEINPQLIDQSRQNAQQAGVTDRVQFLNQDLFETNLSEATVVTLYLLPSINLKLRPQLLQQLRPGTRIVSHDFDMGDWQPERTEQVQGPNRQHTIYYWVVPEQVPANLLQPAQ